MTISMYQTAVPTFVQMLDALSGILDKAAAHAAAKKIEPAVFLNSRLSPDMFPLVRQVQVAADFAKNTVARLAGVEAPKKEDKEASFDELKARIAWTVDYVKGFKVEQIDGSEDRDVTIPMGGKPTTFKGQRYLISFALPNFYFHLTCAHAILRADGVEVGKRDFLGGF